MLLIATDDDAAGRTALRAAWAVALRTRDASFRFLSHLFSTYPHDDLEVRSRELLAADGRQVGAGSCRPLHFVRDRPLDKIGAPCRRSSPQSPHP